MAEAETLRLIAELAIAVAGFSGVAFVLGRRAGDSWDVGRLWMLLVQALGAALFAFMPLLLETADLSASANWRWSNGIDPENVHLYVLPAGVDLCRSAADTKAIIIALAEIAEAAAVELVVVDTLSRALAGGNENSPDDMGAFVRNCDKIRQATGAHLMAIHHTGKDEARGARGHSLIKAAADTELEVNKSEFTNTVGELPTWHLRSMLQTTRHPRRVRSVRRSPPSR